MRRACGIRGHGVSLWLSPSPFAGLLVGIISMSKFHASCQLAPDDEDDWNPGQLVVKEMFGII